MIVSGARRAVAAAMSRGETERSVGIIRRTFESPHAESSPGDIERILRHATAHVPRFRSLAGTRFEDLPVMSKPMMLARPEDFLSEGARPERLASRLSSGTSGVIFRTSLDARRMARHRAELVAAYRYLGADPFGSFLHCRVWFEVTPAQRAAAALRGQRLYGGEIDEESIRRTAGWLRRQRGAVVVGLCSYLEVLLERFEDLGITLGPGAVSVVLGTGEPMTRRLAEMSLRILGVPLRMRYSNTENGLLGFSEPGGTAYKLDTSTFHVEILDHDRDAPAAPGDVGRIVVTDLYNRAMPFIRYDTGDLGRFAVDGGGRPVPNVLAELTGRGRDFPLAGTPHAPRRATHYEILEPVERIPGLRQFQLRQHDIGRFTWIVHADPSPDLDARLRRVLDEEIGDILECTIVHRDGPLHSGAGKRQTFVSEIPDPEALLRRARPA